MPISFTVTPDDAHQSLESFVTRRMALGDHLKARQWVQAGRVTVDSQPGKASRYVQPGQVVRVDPPPPAPHAAEPEALDLPIRHLDEHLVVVAKPAGMATHPGPGWWHGSCVNALLHAIRDWPGVGGVAGPGIVHRLDRDTSGLLVFALSDRAHQALLTGVGAREFEREYLAWVEGTLEGSGTLMAPLARDPAAPQRMAVRPEGKQAITRYAAIAHAPGRTLLRVRLETGRNHQIRVHMAHHGHPVVGDPVYGTPGPVMALHAWRLGFTHPITGEFLRFQESPPASWGPLGPVPSEPAS